MYFNTLDNRLLKIIMKNVQFADVRRTKFLKILFHRRIKAKNEEIAKETYFLYSMVFDILKHSQTGIVLSRGRTYFHVGNDHISGGK